MLSTFCLSANIVLKPYVFPDEYIGGTTCTGIDCANVDPDPGCYTKWIQTIEEPTTSEDNGGSRIQKTAVWIDRSGEGAYDIDNIIIVTDSSTGDTNHSFVRNSNTAYTSNYKTFMDWLNNPNGY